VVTIEDTAELQMQQPHVVRLETRPMNIEGAGAITHAIWLSTRFVCAPTASLSRMPRRGGVDMMQAMNTGTMAP